MRIILITLILIFSNSYLYCQYYNKIIDIYNGKHEIFKEAEHKNGKIYARSLNIRPFGEPWFMRMAKFDENGDLIAVSDKYDNFFSADRITHQTLIVGDSLLCFATKGTEALMQLQVFDLDLDSLERKEYFIDSGEYAEFTFPWFTAQNDESIFATGVVYYGEDNPTGRRREGLIIRLDRETFELDTIIHYTRGTTDFEFVNPQIDANGNLSLSFIEQDTTDNIYGNQYGVIKFDEDFNEIYEVEIPFHHIDDARANHWELGNGNIVFEDKGRDSLWLPISSAAALHCTNLEETQEWRIEEFIWDTNFERSVTQNYSGGVINAEGNLVIASYYKAILSPIEARLICISPEGETLWVRYFQSPDPQWTNTFSGISGLLQEENGDLIMYGGKATGENPNTEHWLIKTDSYGCIEPGCQTTAIETTELKDKYFQILQNPTSEVISFNFSENALNKDSEIVLYDLRGKAIKRKKLSRGTVNGNMLIGNLGSGMYLLQVQENGKILQTEKVIIQ